MALAERLAVAVDAGIVDAEQAQKLSAFLSQSPDECLPRDIVATDGGDPESIRFARGFHDVFLTIGMVALMAGVAIFVGIPLYFIGMALAWGLAEIYVRRRKLVLPGIALACGFVVFSGFCGSVWLTAIASLIGVVETEVGENVANLAGAGSGLIASLAFYSRFRLPFSTGLVAATSAALLGVILAEIFPDIFDTGARALFLASGLVIFAVAMRFDLSDPGRKSLAADNAFWLHLASAPLIMHSAIGFVTFRAADMDELAIFDASMVIVAIAAMAIISVAIDRRALLVSGLVYLGFAIATLIRAANTDEAPVFAITLLVLGTAVVVLGTKWQGARRLIVQSLLPGSTASRLPPLS